MPFIRLSDNYIDHPKFTALSDGSFRLWHEAMAFCRKHQTDGLIPKKTMLEFTSYGPKRLEQLLTPWLEGKNPLIVIVPKFGFKVHDYLEWNLSKEQENQQRKETRLRVAMNRDGGFRRALRERDGDACRYCGCAVIWADRRGPTGATYDHVDPNGGESADNIVISCRGCNSRKGSRTPEVAEMRLLPPPKPKSGSRSDSNIYPVTTGLDRRDRSSVAFQRKELSAIVDDEIAERAGRLIERYQALYTELRKGARLRLLGNSLEFQDACSLCALWDDARLEKIARVILTTDEPFIAGTDRSFKIFTVRASWADDRLRAVEVAS